MPGPGFRHCTLTTPDGATIGVSDLGEGIPVLSIPGATDGASPPRRVFRSVARLYRRYLPRYRVVGATRREPIPAGGDPRRLAADYAWVIEHLGLGRVHVEAGSAGGPIGIWLAIDRPDLVRSLVLSATHAHLDEALAARIRRWIAWAQAGQWRALMRDGMAHTLTPGAWRRYRWTLPLLWLAPTPRSPARMVHMLEGALDVDLRPQLHRIGCPTLVIGGDADRFVSPELQRALATGIPGARHVVIPGQGHGVVLEAPAEQARHVLPFFAAAEGETGG